MRRSLFRAAILLQLAVAGCTDRPAPAPDVAAFPDAHTPPDSILKVARSLKRKAETGSPVDYVMAGLYMGVYYGRTGAFRQSRKELSAALAQTDMVQDPLLKYRIYYGLGNAAKNLAEYPEALKMFSAALRFCGTDSLLIAGVHANIAQLFQLQGDLPHATGHLRYARSLLGNHTQDAAYLLVLHTLANVYGMSGKTDSALLLDAEGLSISRKVGSKSLESTFLDNKANCFMYTGRPDSARYYFRQSLAIDSALGTNKQMADTWLNLGTLERMHGNRQAAQEYLNRSIRMSERSGYRAGAMAGWNVLADLHAETGAYREALEAKSRYYAISDSVRNSRKDAAVAEWNAVFETERKEKELRVQSLQLKQQTQTIWFVSISSILLLSAVYYANRRNKIRKEHRYREGLFAREQQAAVNIVAAEEAERKRIAADLHDGIGQTLTAAWLNLQAIQPKLDRLGTADAELLDTTMQLVGESCAEIRQISHNMMPAMLLNRGLLPAVQELADRILDRRLAVRLSLDADGLRLEKAAELIVYRIIQECVNNVVRHAGATVLYISITADDEELAVMIEDNGAGFYEARSGDPEGIGMQNIRSRVQYLHGSVEWSSSPGDQGGTVVAIHIPMNHDSSKQD